MGSLIIEQHLEIAAPAELVWSVICDLDSYPAWNPFVVACSSDLTVGAPISMRVHIFSTWAQPQRETIFEHEPGRRLCYGLPMRFLGGLASRRSHEVQAIAASRCNYTSHFELTGWLAPVVSLVLGGRLALGFSAMSLALKARAEELFSARG